ncbi:MAG: HTTM domain-containing protein [Nannocystales bacterium]
MESLRGLIHRLDRIVGRLALDGEDPTALGLVRILLVTVLTASLLTHVGAVSEYFSTDSVLFGEWAREAFGNRLSLFFWVEDPWAVRGIFALGVVAHLLWLVGRFTRVAAVVAWVVWVSMFGRNPLLYSLADQLQMVLCTLLMVTPSGNGLSLDARVRGPKPVPVWCRRVLQLQMAVMYTATGLLKDGNTWHDDGTALYYSLSNPYNRHFDIAPTLAALQPWVLKPMTWGVLLWELAFAPFLGMHWLRGLLGRPRRFPDLRWVFLTFGVAMHIGIQSMLYVAWFSPLCIAVYSAFFRPDEVKSIGAKLGRILNRIRRRD